MADPTRKIDAPSPAAHYDPRLAALLRAEGEAVEREIESLIAATRPLTRTLVGRYMRSGGPLQPDDAQDVESAVHLRLVQKLRAVASSSEIIENFDAYVTRVTANAVNDHFRKQFPERSRLKARVRYAATRDGRFALWPGAYGLLCGLAGWRGREEALEEVPQHTMARLARCDHRDAAAALLELFTATGRPVVLDGVVDALAAAWNITDYSHASIDQIAERPSGSEAEDADFLRALWQEIRELQPMQRKALLLNLRFGSDANIISVFILAGIARFDEIAAALEMSRAELAAVWRQLPIEDAEIARTFGITRQQVINLRKAARTRLWRRLRR